MYTAHVITSLLVYILTIITIIDFVKNSGSSKSGEVKEAFRIAGELDLPIFTLLYEAFTTGKLFAFINANNPPFSASKTSNLFNPGNMTFCNIVNVMQVNNDAVSPGKLLNFQIAITGL